MAIIKCPECGHEVSDKARSCPFCGTSIAGNIITCPDCGKILLRSTKTCPNCSCNLEETHIPQTITEISGRQPSKTKPQPTSSSRRNSPIGLIVLCVLLTASAMTCGWMWYITEQDNSMLSAYIDLMDNYSVEDNQEFVQLYPSSPFLKAIKEKTSRLSEADKAWNIISPSSNREDYISFLLSYPQSIYAQECISRLDSLDWLDANSDNTIESYTQYLRKHSKGHFAQLAKKCIQDLNNLIPTDEEKSTANNIVNTYFEKVNQRNAEGMKKILTQKQFQQTANFISEMGPNDSWSIISGINVTKSLSSIPGQYIIIARFKASRQSGYGHTAQKMTYNISMLIYGGNRISMIKFQPVVSAAED